MTVLSPESSLYITLSYTFFSDQSYTVDPCLDFYIATSIPAYSSIASENHSLNLFVPKMAPLRFGEEF